MKEKLDDIIDKYNAIDNDKANVNYFDEYYSHLIDYKTDNIEEIINISTMLSQYFTSLFNLGRYSDLINKRDRVKKYVELLRDKSDKFIDCYTEIEYVYAESLISKGIKYKDAIHSLESVTDLEPSNENFAISLKFARLSVRKEIYHKFVVLGLIIALSGLLLSLIDQKTIYSIIDNIGFGIFALGYFTQYLDSYLTNKCR